MNQTPSRDQPAPTIQPRTPVPGQDPLINPGYQPVPQDLPATAQPERPESDLPRLPEQK